MATGPESVSASWGPPPLETQNGIITAYNLTCQPEGLVADLLAVYPAAGNYSLSGFSPATTYNCTVFAVTAGGSGPPATQAVTLFDDGTKPPQASTHMSHMFTLIAVPGPVPVLLFTSISATVLQISWTSPEVTNGGIQLYSVLVKTRASSVFQANVPGEQRTVLVANLSKI